MNGSLTIGCIEYKGTSFYAGVGKTNILRNMVITDEMLDNLGEQYQSTCAKHERGWSFYDWVYEMIGIKLW